MKTTSLILIIMILISPAMAKPARAEAEGNVAYIGIALAAVAFLIVSWNMDYSNDEPITMEPPPEEGVQLVFCQPSGNTSAGLGLRGAF